MILSNKVYDTLKWCSQLLLPSVATLYFGLAAIWKLPAPEQVTGTLLALSAFIGAVLGLSNMQYKEKKLVEKQMAFFSSDDPLGTDPVDETDPPVDPPVDPGDDNPGDPGSEPPDTNPPTDPSPFPFNLTHAQYEFLKWMTIIVLPAFGGLYLTLSQLWGFPGGQQVVGSIAAITACLGIILGFSTSNLRKALSV